MASGGQNGHFKAFWTVTDLVVRPTFLLLGVMGILISLSWILLSITAVCIIPAGSMQFTAARMELEQFPDALEKYRSDCGQYPDSRIGLESLVSNPGVMGWNGPYVKPPLRDPWGRPFLYELSGGVPIVRSLGADGKPGGDLFDKDLSSEAPLAPLRETAFHVARDYFRRRIEPWLWLVVSVSVVIRTRHPLAPGPYLATRKHS